MERFYYTDWIRYAELVKITILITKEWMIQRSSWDNLNFTIIELRFNWFDWTNEENWKTFYLVSKTTVRNVRMSAWRCQMIQTQVNPSFICFWCLKLIGSIQPLYDVFSTLIFLLCTKRMKPLKCSKEYQCLRKLRFFFNQPSNWH